MNPFVEDSISFVHLFDNDEDALGVRYPSQTGDSYDRSSADLALANKLAFYTGNNCELMMEGMLRSKLNRLEEGHTKEEKWDPHSDYLRNTILSAVKRQENGPFYSSERYDESYTPDWSNGPEPGWSGETDDSYLIAEMRKAGLNTRKEISNHALLENDAVKLLQFFAGKEKGTIDYRSAYLELARRLLVKTGKDCERTLRLLEYSHMGRDDLDLRNIVQEALGRIKKLQQTLKQAHLKPFEGCTLVSNPPCILNAEGKPFRIGVEADLEYGGLYYPIGPDSEGNIKTAKTFSEWVRRAAPEFGIPRKAQLMVQDPQRPFGEISFDSELGAPIRSMLLNTGQVAAKREIPHQPLGIWPNLFPMNVIKRYFCLGVLRTFNTLVIGLGGLR